MGTTRTDIFSTDQNRMARIFKALAHPARIAILQYLSQHEGCICNDIVDEIGLAQPTISQHLKELRSQGLIKGEVEGKRTCYCIDPDAWETLHGLVDSFFKTTQNNCC